MNPFSIVILLAQTSETSTATWGVLMLVVGFLTAAVFAGWRIYSTKLSDANKRADVSDEKAADARHAQIITKIDGVKESVDGVAHRMDKVEDRVGHLEQGHERLEIQIQSIKEGGER